MPRKVKFDTEDTTVLDFEAAVPEETLKSLMCRTEEALLDMHKLMTQVSAQLADSSDIMSDKLPKLIEAVESVETAIQQSRKEGIAKSDETIKLMKEMIVVNKGVRDELASGAKSTESTRARKGIRKV